MRIGVHVGLFVHLSLSDSQESFPLLVASSAHAAIVTDVVLSHAVTRTCGSLGIQC